MSEKIPLSILCGFLGAGKTTVVQHVLRNREDLKIGVIVNDVSSVNIDAALLSLSGADGIMGLRNGCVCCSSRDDLMGTLEQLARSAGSATQERRWDHLIIECTGIADPLGISQELRSMAAENAALLELVVLAGIICVVDASTFLEQYHSEASGRGGRPLSSLLVSQVECASTVVINKTDLVSATGLRETTDLISALNPEARCIPAVAGNLPLRTLLPRRPIGGAPAYVPPLARRHAAALAAATAPPGGCLSHHSVSTDASHAAHGHDGHSHDHGQLHDGIRSFAYLRPQHLFDASRLAAAARQLPVSSCVLGGRRAWPPGRPAATAAFAGLLRSKGFVRVKGDKNPYYWSHAGRRLTLTEFAAAPGDGQELVFIGRDLNEETITQILDACLVEEDKNASRALKAKL
eukprot:TRINITY_DN57280_c0_g1_i1.p1 TRINITY_DN57280_c0_g1~~TRINITY_DN57280_c0_g1_i1.p1  ORF type:complete len:407 (-),score=83.51 TRINITY_DN57280_c0_g1_i1:84-1304(-)